MIMKSFVVLSCVVAVALAASTYDIGNLNIKELIENDKLFESYANCLLDKGKCTPQAKDLKGIMQEGLETGCEKCTDEQKDDVAMITDHMIKNKPDIWEQMTSKYDSSGVYRKKYEEEARSRGIVYN